MSFYRRVRIPRLVVVVVVVMASDKCVALFWIIRCPSIGYRKLFERVMHDLSVVWLCARVCLLGKRPPPLPRYYTWGVIMVGFSLPKGVDLLTFYPMNFHFDTI